MQEHKEFMEEQRRAISASVVLASVVLGAGGPQCSMRTQFWQYMVPAPQGGDRSKERRWQQEAALEQEGSAGGEPRHAFEECALANSQRRPAGLSSLQVLRLAIRCPNYEVLPYCAPIMRFCLPILGPKQSFVFGARPKASWDAQYLWL
jgi:hypothetical protein